MNNVEGSPESALTVFGGLVVEVDPPSVPSGSSPLCCDMDFTVASARTRDGLVNVYTYCNSVAETLAQALHGWSTGGGVNPSFELYGENCFLTTPAVLDITIVGTGVAVGDIGMLIVEAASDTHGPYQVPPTFGIVMDNFGNAYNPIGSAVAYQDPTFGFYARAQNYQVTFATAMPNGTSLQIQMPYTPADAGGTIILVTMKGITALDQVRTVTSGGATETISLSITNSSPDLIFAICGPAAYTVSPSTFKPQNVSLSPAYLSAYQDPSTGYNVAQPNTYSVTWTNLTNQTLYSYLIGFTVAGGTSPTQSVAPGGTSPVLDAVNYGFNIPTGVQILGIEVQVTGSQTAVGGIVTLTPLYGSGTPIPTQISLPLSAGTVPAGDSSDLWGETWTPAQINNPSFGFAVQASNPTSSPITFNITQVSVTVWFTPPGVTQFDYIKSFGMTDGGLLTLALDDTGVFWQEDVINDPGVLCPFYTAIEPDTFCRSVTEDDREFIGLSQLGIGGTDMPRQYNGQWVDRISQVGPAIAPTVTFSTTQYPIVTITQAPPVDMSMGGDYTFVWSENSGTTTAGNVISIQARVGLLSDVIAAGVGATIVLAGLPSVGGQNPNGTYIISAVGTVPTAHYGSSSPFFSVIATVSNHTDQTLTSGSYELTLATLTTSVTVPNLQVGGQATVSGTSDSGYDNMWTITATPNASQMTITDTSLTSNVATYAYTLVSGTAPVVGQQVTVTGTTNGDGIFNVVNAIIQSETILSPTSGTFTLQIIAANITAAGETGNAIVNGTQFQFDPGSVLANSTGGFLSVAGGLGAGVRGCVQLFLTRNGLLTAPSPQAIFTLNADANSITVSNLAIGPDDVIARVVAFTGAGGATQTGGGGFYFWIPEPVSIVDNGQIVTYTATIVNDNTSTQATFTFTDAVLLAAASISNQGTNNFAQIELGSCLGVTAYADRLVAWGEQNKIQNLLNYSFDGGIGRAVGSSVTTYPLGWTVDPINGTGGSLTNSPLFGNAYYILNSSGSTQAVWGMITQPAYKDFYGAPIVASATPYSIRVTADSPSGAASGNLAIDLYSPTSNQVWGAYTLPLSSLTTTMQIFTHTLLASPFATVPSDLLIRIYATSIPNGGDVLIDRIEPFPTLEPVLTTNLRVSYFDNFEAFDQITGNIGAGSQNQQPIRNVFSLFDNLYIVKTNSFYTTADNGTTEPDGWKVREVSNKVGTPSIYGVDVGEGWALIAGQAGLYLFSGGDPIKCSPEIDPVWQSINWTYGNTIWVRNDTTNRKIFIGVPIPTPNQWMPKFPANANPMVPNVVLMCSYKELMTSSALAGEGPVRMTYTGELKTFPLGRKWSAWSIEACYADFITRPTTLTPLFFCPDTGVGKIYQQLAGNWADDGKAMHCEYVTYPFPKTLDAQTQQMGLHQLQADFMSMLVVGNGNLRMTIYPDTLQSPDAETLYPEPLFNPPAYGDVEIPLNIEGARFFIGLSVRDAYEWFDIARLIMTLKQSPWAPVRGRNG